MRISGKECLRDVLDDQLSYVQPPDLRLLDVEALYVRIPENTLRRHTA